MNDDDSEIPIRNQQKNIISRSSSSYKANQRNQINSPNTDFYNHNNHHLTNNCATMSSSSFENESNEPFTNMYPNSSNNSIIQSRLNIKSTPTTPTPLSAGNNPNLNGHHNHNHHHHNQHQNGRFPNPQNTKSLSNNQTQSTNYIHSNNQLTSESQNYYSLSRNDDYLINNFRPFNANASNSNFRQGQPYVSQPVVPSTSNTRVHNSMNTLNNNNNYSNQRSHLSNSNSSSYSNSPSNGYNGNSYYRNKELDQINNNNMIQVDRNSTRHQQNGYVISPSTPHVPHTYTRSNTVLNNISWKMSNGINVINEKNDFNSNYDEQDHYSNRNEPNG